MLVNVAESEECRVAVIDGGRLEELYVERASLGSIVGNVYKGRVVNLEAGIQAAFVDLGTGRNGFLHISDLHPRYFPGRKNDLVESVGRRQSLKDRPPIQDCLRKGSEIVVQVTKEGLKTKGPTLSTYPALPGKYLVMMPWMKKNGVSHKIEDDDERKRLKEILEDSNPPKGVGFIIRTAGASASKRDLQSDLRYLARMWTDIEKRMENTKAPVELFQESDLVIRALRDVFNNQIKNIICDSPEMVRKIKDFLAHAYPRTKQRVTTYDSPIPLFHKYRIEPEIEKIQSRTVALRSGGSIVIEQTEALVAIDVNSGRHHGQVTAEQTALETNLEAAVEIARQLRLRDLGGLIICDFIDMRQQKNRKEVERVFRQAIKADRARSKTLAISRFGIVEMTRQRMRTSLQSSIYLACPHCAGMGFIKSHESLALEVIRLLNLAAAHPQISRIELSVSPEVAEYLQNEKRASLVQIEQSSDRRIVIHAVPDYGAGQHEMTCYNARGSVIRLGNIQSALRGTSDGGEKRETRSSGRDVKSRNGRSRGNGRDNGKKKERGARRSSQADARGADRGPKAEDGRSPVPEASGERSEDKQEQNSVNGKEERPKSKSRGRGRRRSSRSETRDPETPESAEMAAPPAESKDAAEERQESESDASREVRSKSKGRTRGRRRASSTETAEAAKAVDSAEIEAAGGGGDEDGPEKADAGDGETRPKSRSRGRGRGRRRTVKTPAGEKSAATEAETGDTKSGSETEAKTPSPETDRAEKTVKKSTSRRRRGAKVSAEQDKDASASETATAKDETPAKQRTRPQRRRVKAGPGKAPSDAKESADRPASDTKTEAADEG
jgi:ribonuclease E